MVSVALISALVSLVSAQTYGLISIHSGDSSVHQRTVKVNSAGILNLVDGNALTFEIKDGKAVVGDKFLTIDSSVLKVSSDGVSGVSITNQDLEIDGKELASACPNDSYTIRWDGVCSDSVGIALFAVQAPGGGSGSGSDSSSSSESSSGSDASPTDAGAPTTVGSLSVGSATGAAGDAPAEASASSSAGSGAGSVPQPANAANAQKLGMAAGAAALAAALL